VCESELESLPAVCQPELEGLPAEPTLQGLPAELRDHIAEYLQRNHLAVFARVSKMLAKLVEDVLYKSVELHSSENASPPEADDDKSQGAFEQLYVANFCRTMLERPDLRSRVKSARLVVSFTGVPMNVCLLHGLVDTLSTVFNVTVSEATLAGTLLTLLSDVTSLSLDTWNVVDKDRQNAPCMLFQSEARYARENPELVPAFGNLTVLSWSSLLLPFIVACLPKLDHLHISSECAIEDPGSNALAPRLSKLTIYRSTTIFFPPYEPKGTGELDASVLHFIKCCVSLRQLVIGLDRERHPIPETLGQGVTGDLSGAVTQLHKLRPELESFTLRAARKLHNSFLDHVTPIASYTFHPFTGLKHLRIPQIQLFGADKDEEPLKQQSIASLLPPALEHLEVDYPGKTILDFLNWVVQERETVPSLAKITLYCAYHRCNRGIACTDESGTRGLLDQWNEKKVVKDLRGLGIVVAFLEMEDAWR
jgi:hypothetical protein